MKKTIAVLLGDGAGIGPEQVAKCAVSGFMTEHCNPIICGDKRVFDRALAWVGAPDFHYELIESFENLEFSGAPRTMCCHICRAFAVWKKKVCRKSRNGRLQKSRTAE